MNHPFRWHLLAMFGFLSQAYAQSPSKTPAFEVASIRRCAEGEQGGTASPGYLESGCQPLLDLIRSAYVYYDGGHFNWGGINRIPILGGPAWIKSDLYAITAKPETPQTTAMMVGPMMERLLVERFNLKIHREQKLGPAYQLMLAKGGPRLEPFQPGSCVPRDLDNPGTAPQPLAPDQTYCGMQLQSKKGAAVVLNILGWTLDDFSNQQFQIVGRPVINKTGLTGKFNFHLEYAPDQQTSPGSVNAPNADVLDLPSEPTGLPSFSRALEHQLGLKLVTVRALRDTLIIDSVERPSEN